MPRVPKTRKSRARNGPYEVSDVMMDANVGEKADSQQEGDDDTSFMVDKIGAMAEGIATKKLSKKEKRRLEVARKKEAAEAKAQEEEVNLSTEEQSKRQLRRKHVGEFKDVKSQISAMKKKRSRLGRKSQSERDARKKINKTIKEMLSNLKARHTAEWRLAGFDQTEDDNAMYEEKDEETMD